MNERRAKRRDELARTLNVEARLRVLKLRDLKKRLQSSRSGQDRIEVIVGKLAPQRHKVVVGRRSGKRRHGDARIRAVAV